MTTRKVEKQILWFTCVALLCSWVSIHTSRDAFILPTKSLLVFAFQQVENLLQT